LSVFSLLLPAHRVRIEARAVRAVAYQAAIGARSVVGSRFPALQAGCCNCDRRVERLDDLQRGSAVHGRQYLRRAEVREDPEQHVALKLVIFDRQEPKLGDAHFAFSE
jgi:hypothetical protein